MSPARPRQRFLEPGRSQLGGESSVLGLDCDEERLSRNGGDLNGLRRRHSVLEIEPGPRPGGWIVRVAVAVDISHVRPEEGDDEPKIRARPRRSNKEECGHRSCDGLANDQALTCVHPSVSEGHVRYNAELGSGVADQGQRSQADRMLQTSSP
jgi:hypothetical protein